MTPPQCSCAQCHTVEDGGGESFALSAAPAVIGRGRHLSSSSRVHVLIWPYVPAANKGQSISSGPSFAGPSPPCRSRTLGMPFPILLESWLTDSLGTCITFR